MKPENTRFNPTLDGDLHLGHLVTILVNMREAKARGGKFIIRFDDDQEIWQLRQRPGDTDAIRGGMMDDLEYCHITNVTDEIYSQGGRRHEMNQRLNALNDASAIDCRILSNMVWVNNSADMIGQAMVMYPYHPWLTMEKVVYDDMDAVKLLIRGYDLITESSLYAFFCDAFRIPQPVQYYIPRLLDSTNQEMAKSRTSIPIRLFRENNIPFDLVYQSLAESYLVEPARGFRLDNIKPPAECRWNPSNKLVEYGIMTTGKIV